MRLPIRLIPTKTNFDFISYKSMAFAFSIFISIAAILMLFIKGLNLGVDFSGGIILEARLSGTSSIHDVRKSLSKYGYHNAVIQNLNQSQDIVIRLHPKESSDQIGQAKEIKSVLQDSLNNTIEFRRVDYVGPKVGQQLINNGIYAILAAIICMLLYIWFRFDWQFGVGAVISLAHDALITLGFYSLSGYDFDLTSIAALLTVVGYSINDTVVIYDRIRENLKKNKEQIVENIVNLSINETLSRTIMTVATTLLVCLALVLVGGEVLRGFSMALLFGIAFGTYSSIYIAAPILTYTGIKVNK